MTAKQKATELVDKFIIYCTYDKDGLVTPLAKQCALICVDEIILVQQDYISPPQWQRYWVRVKKEIAKL